MFWIYINGVRKCAHPLNNLQTRKRGKVSPFSLIKVEYIFRCDHQFLIYNWINKSTYVVYNNSSSILWKRRLISPNFANTVDVFIPFQFNPFILFQFIPTPLHHDLLHFTPLTLAVRSRHVRIVYFTVFLLYLVLTMCYLSQYYIIVFVVIRLLVFMLVKTNIPNKVFRYITFYFFYRRLAYRRLQTRLNYLS